MQTAATRAAMLVCTRSGGRVALLHSVVARPWQFPPLVSQRGLRLRLVHQEARGPCAHLAPCQRSPALVEYFGRVAALVLRQRSLSHPGRVSRRPLVNNTVVRTDIPGSQAAFFCGARAKVEEGGDRVLSLSISRATTPLELTFYRLRSSHQGLGLSPKSLWKVLGPSRKKLGLLSSGESTDTTASTPEWAQPHSWTLPEAAAMNEIAPPPPMYRWYQPKLSCDLCSVRQLSHGPLFSLSPSSRSLSSSLRMPRASSSSPTGSRTSTIHHLRRVG
ncbi:hypothetical protein MRX96_021480 [Rhipicephalus microplus]